MVLFHNVIFEDHSMKHLLNTYYTVGTVLDARATGINMIPFSRINVQTQFKVKHESDSHSLAYWCYCHLHGNKKQERI